MAAAKAAVPTVGDQSAALQLGNFAKSTAAALAELRTASAKVGVAVWNHIIGSPSPIRLQKCVAV